MMADVPDNETITLHATVVDGNGYPDGYQVVWRSLPIGRIIKGTGSPNHEPQWWWECNVYGQPSLGGGRGTGVDLDDCKAKFEAAWARVRGGITEVDIAMARQYVDQRASEVGYGGARWYPRSSSSGCTHPQGAISRSLVSLIMCTGGE